MSEALSANRYARYIGRVGGLAVLLGVGAAVATGVAHADTASTSDTSTASPASDASASTPAASPAAEANTEAADNDDETTAEDAVDEDAVDEDAADEDAVDEPADSDEDVVAPEPESVADDEASETVPDAETEAEAEEPAAEVTEPEEPAAEEPESSTQQTLTAENTSSTADLSPTETIITGLYREILREDPTAAELARYSNLLSWFGTRAVVASLYNSSSFRNDQVDSYYMELLGRLPSESERALDTLMLRLGVPETMVIARLAGSDEFYEESGGDATSFVNLMYRSMLGQTADPNALPLYVNRLQAGLPATWVATQFVTSDPFRAVKVQETFEIVLGRAATDEEVATYVRSWFFRGGQAGIAKSLLASSENMARVLDSAGIPLPDMFAVSQLQQLLRARYTEGEDGFVRLFNTYMQMTLTGEPCAPQQVCNTALYNLLRTGGLTRGIPNESIVVKAMNASTAGLRPTQNEVGVNNSLSFPLTHADTLAQYLTGGTVIAGSVILTANGGEYIVDGHHRWSSVYVINPYTEISAVDLGYVPNAQEALRETQLAIGAQLGYLPVQQISGPNLFTISRADFNTSVAQLINSGSDPTAVMNVFKNMKQLNDMAAVQDYLWANVQRMREFNVPVEGATGRGYMPQPPEYESMFHLMENGSLIYTLPVLSVLG